MICPYCHNKDWDHDWDCVELLKGTRHTAQATFRRHTCHNCGGSWESIEELHQVQNIPLQLSFFDWSPDYIHRQSPEYCFICGENRVGHMKNVQHFDHGTYRNRGCFACQKRYQTIQRFYRAISHPQDLKPVGGLRESA